MKKDNRNCRVFCKTLNRWFKTITSAANFAKVDNWTMSRKVEQLVKQLAFADYPKPIQNLINEKLTDMIINNKPWAEIKQFMKDTGYKAITIRTDNE